MASTEALIGESENREERIANIHPGEILREEFLEPMGITAYRLAKSVDVSQTRIGEILDGKRSITADTALRLGRFFGTTAQFWINLQTRYDLEEAELSNRGLYERIPAFV